MVSWSASTVGCSVRCSASPSTAIETLLKGFNQAYNRRRQRVVTGRTPEQVVQRRLAAEPKLANRRYKPPNPGALPPALQVVAAAKEVSHPDT
jgi:hypothetical protein